LLQGHKLAKMAGMGTPALTEALGLGTTPVWSGGNLEHRQNHDQMTLEQSTQGREQTQVDENRTERQKPTWAHNGGQWRAKGDNFRVIDGSSFFIE